MLWLRGQKDSNSMFIISFQVKLLERKKEHTIKKVKRNYNILLQCFQRTSVWVLVSSFFLIRTLPIQTRVV